LYRTSISGVRYFACEWPIEAAQLISGQHSRNGARDVRISATAIGYGRSWSRHLNHERIQAAVEMATKEVTP